MMHTTFSRDQQALLSSSTATANRQQQQRNKFTADVIRAIEELEFRRINRSPQQLADAAWQKLQYDLPVVELPELQALLERLRSSLQGKTCWPCYLLTSKALDNITAGAKRSATFEPVLPDHEQKLQQLLEDALTSSLSSKAGRASSSSSSSSSSALQSQQQAYQQAQQQQQQQQDNPSAQQLYQQLCAVLLLQYTAKVASLPEQEAWQLLIDYRPEQIDEQDASRSVEPQQQQGQGQQISQQGLDSNDDSAVIAALAAAASPCSSSSGGAAEGALGAQGSIQQHSTSIDEAQEAAVLDDDDEQYEDLAPVPSTANNNSRSRQYLAGTSMAPAVQQPQQYSWPVLRHKLNSIAEHVHHSVLAYEPLWQQHQAAQHLLQLLRALGVHNQAEQLKPMLHAYVGLLVDRLAAAPADLPLLQQLWEALGLTSGGGLRHISCSGFSGAAKLRQQGLPSEAVLGFSVAASVWSQVQGASARAKLWKLMYGNLLPVLERCLDQLAYNMSAASNTAKQASSSGNVAQANGTAPPGSAHPQQPQQQAVLGEGFAHMLLLSHVVELLVLGRQGPVDVAAQLIQCGAMRSMAVLFGQYAGDAAAEPLRRAVLFASCSSQQAASWVLAVPSVLQQLQQPEFQLHGSAEAHGAVWELLISTNSSSQAVCKSGGVQCSQLQALLVLSPAVVGDLQRQVALLQLLVDVQKAGRQQLWTQDLRQLLKQLASNIKELQGTAAAQAAAAVTDACAVQLASGASSTVGVGPSKGLSNGTAAAAAQEVNGAEGNSQSCSDDEGKGAKAARRMRQQLQQRRSVSDAGDAQDLGHRQSQQLQSAALKLIKQLLTSGGKTD